MDEIYEALTHRALTAHQKRLEKGGSAGRTLIALSGAPGSGKSTIAAEVTRRLNRLAGRQIAAAIPMDGFHYPRAHLDTLPNRDEAHARRGAHWTFDAAGVVSLARRLSSRAANKNDGDDAIIYAPGFDHAAKDPVADAIPIGREREIVILEGNWLLFDVGPWREIAGLVDDSWFVEVSAASARERVARRHLRAGIERTWEAAVRRAEGNDLPNGEEIRRRLVKPGYVVRSVDEPLRAD
ncbi:P-loop containing nucleoside triphosphate hydrolase protein [Biscogniauxia mediterranea]|nr:P-loop containing nucleoside triphosphate hydrolase protein [Biscogniauxia mediterranea]